MAPRTAAASKGNAPAKASARNATAKAATSKKASTAAKPSRSRKAAASSALEEDGSQDDDVEEDAAPAPKPKKAAATKKAPTSKSTTASKKNVKKAAEDEEDESPEDASTRKKTAKKPSAANGTAGAKTNGIKRKVEESGQEDEGEEQVNGEVDRPAKKARVAAAPRKRVVAPAGPTLGTPINELLSKKLDIFVFGEGSSGELGLGSKKFEGKKPIDVKRPRINHNLSADSVGVVQIACGGMHAVALTHDNRILTWGVNDDRALGRDTTWDGGTRDVDDEDSDDEDDDTGVNPNESTPAEVDNAAFIPGTKIAQVVATDSASFALTEDGSVYGWGTFRGADGIIGFNEHARIQPTPVQIPELKKIKRLATGSNHVLALDKDGKVWTWGSGGQYQLGRKPFTRHGGVKASLKPEPCGKFTARHHAVDIAAGSYHSFYLDNYGKLWGWGLNNYSQTGHKDDTGKDDAMVLIPRVVESLEGKKVVSIAGGEHHSVASTADGDLLTWGRVDGHQVGHPSDLFTEDNSIFDENGKPRILIEPTPVQGIKATFVAAGTDTSFALDDAGKVYSWGFSANYQTGQGTTDDIVVPTLIDNTAVRGRKITWAGAGGQYSMLAAVHGDNVPNGH